MVKMRGYGIIASWRPYEEGRGGAAMRASEKECESITIFGDIVLARHKDGFWETISLDNCTVTWMNKPEIVMVDMATGQETPVEVAGKTNTIADGMKIGLRRGEGSFAPMGSESGKAGIIS